jgi:tetratricopeptide (TPR) repeat protein
MVSNSAQKKEISDLALDELLYLRDLLAEKKHGKPNYGAILRYFRLRAGWTAGRLASLYSEALGLDEDHLITPSWIYIMENQNQVPINEKRRWLLTGLLNIPPMLFGLGSLDTSLSDLLTWERVDVQEYRATLERYSQRWHTGSVFQATSDIKKRISNLYREAPHSQEKKEMLDLLCGYLILMGDIAGNHMELDTALAHFNRVVQIAEQENLYDRWALALRQRGVVYVKLGEVAVGAEGYTAAQPHFTQATLNAQAMQSLETKIQPALRGLLLGPVADAYASIAQDEHEFKKALETLDQAKAFIGKRADDVYTLGAVLDEERYHLDRAHVHLISPFWNVDHAKAARSELEQASKRNTLNSLDRRSSYASLLAKSYLVEGQYAIAVAYAEEALNTIQASGSVIKLARLDMIYQYLKKCDYGKSEEIALFGVKLFKVQHPELFAE